MYQSPDFVRVSTKVKDVFAAYNVACTYAELVTVMLGECVKAGENFQTYIEAFPEAPYICGTTDII